MKSLTYFLQEYGGCFTPSYDMACYSEGSTFKGIPTRSGATFVGFYTSSTPGAGTQVIDATGKLTVSNKYFTSDTTVYAHWKSTPTMSRNTWRPITDASGNITGYYVYAYITVDSGDEISSVQFPSWTAYNGQDDIQSSWSISSAAAGTAGTYTVSGNSYNYRYAVMFSTHNNEKTDVQFHKCQQRIVLHRYICPHQKRILGTCGQSD